MAPVIVVLLAWGMLSASNASAEGRTSFAREPYDLVELPPDELPYADGRLGRLAWATVDPVGVRQFRHVDGTLHDHPVQLAQEVLRLLDDHAAGGGDVYLEMARSHADRLLKIGFDAQGVLFLPYLFDFALHGNVHDMMRAPWYSAMAQGQALSAFVRLFEVTGDEPYAAAADAVFASFLEVRDDPGMPAPWTVFVDDAGYLWFEEYAKDPPMRVLNGHLFALFGLYDYVRLTDDPAARRLFQAGATTVRQYGSEFRNPGELSSYCLRWHETSEKYHFIHINQLRMLAAMTGDGWFAHLADRLADDYAVSPSARSPALLGASPGRSSSPRR